MSKIVKRVLDPLKLVKGATKLVKKVAKSKFGKIALLAVATYFGVPAIMGAFGGAAGAGASGLAGALNGISGAWSGLTGAASSAMAGNLAQAGSQLAGGMTGSGGLVGGAMSGGAATPAAAGWVPSSSGLNVLASEAAMPAATKGLVGGTMASNPYLAPALVNAGSQIIGGIGQGKMIKDEREYQERLAGEERARYNTNVGTSLWGAAPRG